MMSLVLHFLFGLLIMLPVTGELFRLSLMGFDLLPSDILLPVLFGVWGFDKLRNDRTLRLGKIGKGILIFMFTVIATYLINFFWHDTREMLVAGAYMARFFMYAGLAVLGYDLLQRDQGGRFLKLVFNMLTLAMLMICVLGFLQLRYFPSFFELGMYLEGWDPHIGRLLSTWFDPNFIGGYLAFILGPLIALGLYFRSQKDRRRFWKLTLIVLIALLALYLTYSRSGYLALLTTLFFLALFKSRKLLLATLVICLVAFSFSARVQERVTDALDSGKALFGLDSQQPIDPTVQLRLDSWGYAREMIKDHPLIGIGFGRYKYEINQRGYGLLSEHSSGGSDSSLLTLWATTGVFGLIAYLWIALTVVLVSVKRMMGKNDLKSYVYAGVLSGFSGLLIHSIFVNSLLFPLMMVPMMAVLAVADSLNGTSPLSV